MWLICWLEWDGKATIVHARGEIDAFTSARLGQCIRTALMDSRGEVILDLSEVTFIDGAGLRVLDQFQQDCRGRDLSFGLTRPAAHILRLLELVDLDRVLPVLDSTSERRAGAPVRNVSNLGCDGRGGPSAEQAEDPVQERRRHELDADH